MTVELYRQMTPDETFAKADEMATQLFDTPRWKTLFADRYGYTRQAVQEWKNKGAPIWALVALEDALKAKKLDALAQLIRNNL